MPMAPQAHMGYAGHMGGHMGGHPMMGAPGMMPQAHMGYGAHMGQMGQAGQMAQMAQLQGQMPGQHMYGMPHMGGNM